MNIKEHQRWVKDNGDKTKRLEYDLNSHSVVFDIGGFKGDWTQQIFSRYNCEIYIFEPISKFYNDIKRRFVGKNKIKIFNFGLDKIDKGIDIFNSNDSSSVFNKTGSAEKIQLKDIKNFCIDNKIKTIDLMKINIEGCEYDLLDRIVYEFKELKIKNIQKKIALKIK